VAGAAGVSRLQVVMFLRALGVVLIVGGVSYLLSMLALFLVPDLGERISGLLAIPPTIAEVWMLGYLLVLAVRTPEPDEAPPAVG
jgi:hypothetical protein